MTLASLVLAGITTSDMDHEHLAPLKKAQGSDKLDGEYIVTLKDDHDMAQHFGHIQQNLHIDPSTDWNYKWWKSANAYHVTHLTSESLNHIRRDPGVHSVFETELLSM